MPDIKPFRAVMYNRNSVRLEDVVAPPYDVISSAQRDALYDRSPYNVVRLILGKEPDPYASAAAFFREWKSTGILVREPEAAVLLLAQAFSDENGVKRERVGFIAASRLEELSRSTIFPHERTLAEPVEDRLRLFRSTGAMFSQVFAFYSDPGRETDACFDSVLQRPPDGEAVADGVHNRFWLIRDQGTILRLQTLMEHMHVYIADGHHRYETGLAYASQRRTHNPAHTGKEAYNFLPLYFTNLANPGLRILPTHRLVSGLPEFSPERFLRRAGELFTAKRFESLDGLRDALAAGDGTEIGAVLGGHDLFMLLRLNDHSAADQPGVPRVLSILGVSILEHLVLKRILGMTAEDIREKRHLEYLTDSRLLVRRVREGSAQAGFLVSPPGAEVVRSVAEAGLVMPQKSTYFYPKLLSGLCIYSFTED